jgi:hypothetical protein
MEICLPPSGLGKVAYPDVFPTPPTGSPGPAETLSDANVATDHERSSSQSMSSASLLEKSWCYYLSDIAVRRIANRLVNAFYQDSASSWLSIPVERLSRVAEELDLQLTQWYLLPAFQFQTSAHI